MTGTSRQQTFEHIDVAIPEVAVSGSRPSVKPSVSVPRPIPVQASINDSEQPGLDDLAHEYRRSISVLLRCAAAHVTTTMTHRELLNMLDMNRFSTRMLLEPHNTKQGTDLRRNDRAPMDVV